MATPWLVSSSAHAKMEAASFRLLSASYMKNNRNGPERKHLWSWDYFYGKPKLSFLEHYKMIIEKCRNILLNLCSIFLSATEIINIPCAEIWKVSSTSVHLHPQFVSELGLYLCLCL